MKKVKKNDNKIESEEIKFQNGEIAQLMIQNLTRVIKMKLCLLKKISLKIILKMRFIFG